MKPTQFGCKRCGGVISIEVKVSSNRIEQRTKDGRPYEHSGTIEVRCKKCNRPVVLVAINQAK